MPLYLLIRSYLPPYYYSTLKLKTNEAFQIADPPVIRRGGHSLNVMWVRW
jgi:hypothetical protein